MRTKRRHAGRPRQLAQLVVPETLDVAIDEDDDHAPPARPAPRPAPRPAAGETDKREATTRDQAAATPASSSAATGARAECARFIEAFGPDGAKWFAKGLTFEAAQAKHVAALNAKLADAERRLAAVEKTERGAFHVGENLGKLARKNAAALARPKPKAVLS